LVGAFLNDYVSGNYHIPVGARNAANILGTLFLLCFMMCDIQACMIIALVATIAFIIIMMSLCIGTAAASTANQRYRR